MLKLVIVGLVALAIVAGLLWFVNRCWNKIVGS
jgi:Flp pilus assembly pilin Flp